MTMDLSKRQAVPFPRLSERWYAGNALTHPKTHRATPPMSTDATISTGKKIRKRIRYVALPLLLFLATCISTFWTGSVDWKPLIHWNDLLHGTKSFWEKLPQGSPLAALQQGFAVAHIDWQAGLLYMGAVMGILLAHEMGHFLVALRYRIPASLPYFIPVPILPFGTMGAVIGMEGSKANRREMFDLGIAGPLAGLAVTLPILWIGILRLPHAPEGDPFWFPDSFCFHNPLLLQFLIAHLRPDYPTPQVFYINQFNPFLMAGWVGMLVTGLNALPIGQLDGGHTAYALLRQQGHVLARGLIILAIVMIVLFELYIWLIMLFLVILLGTDHPPTADDSVDIGWFRWVLGWAALLLPVYCFPLQGVSQVGR
jgi:hypothetical protein